MDTSFIADTFSTVFAPVLNLLSTTFFVLLFTVLGAIGSFLLIFWLRYFRFFKMPSRFAKLKIKFLPYDLLRWIWIDWTRRGTDKEVFKEYGFTIFTGRQGAGKTISLVDYLDRLRVRYPKLKIYTNFKYKYADGVMTDWDTFFRVRNGTDGVVFAIDEVQNEFSSADWKDFPAELLSQITMQRKQRIKIVATSQVYTRIAKQLREQTFSVCMCSCWFRRLVYVREYDAAEYSLTADSPYQAKKKCKPLSRHIYVQSDELRDEFDTWEVVNRMRRKSESVAMPSKREVLAYGNITIKGE